MTAETWEGGSGGDQSEPSILLLTNLSVSLSTKVDVAALHTACEE